jgi:hypothetical protein
VGPPLSTAPLQLKHTTGHGTRAGLLLLLQLLRPVAGCRPCVRVHLCLCAPAVVSLSCALRQPQQRRHDVAHRRVPGTRHHQRVRTQLCKVLIVGRRLWLWLWLWL